MAVKPQASPDVYSPWLPEAYALLGLREVPGHIHEARILSMWQRLGIQVRDDETPWCAAFVGAMLEAVGIRSTRSGAARSYLKWGRPLQGPVYGTGHYGSIVVLSRPGSSWSGHVGFLVGQSAGWVDLLGGNQGNRVSVAKFPTHRILGVRWPEFCPLPPIDLEATLPANVPLSTGEA